MLHQGILALFRDDPWLAFDLLDLPRPVDGTPLDRRAEVEIDGHRKLELRQGFPDLVLIYKDPDNPEDGLVITVEAQKQPDRKKRWRLPVYQALLAEDNELQAWVVVVSFSSKMSQLLREWRNGPPPRVDALIIDVDTVPLEPWISSTDRPTAAVLAAVLHGYAGDIDAARRGFEATRSMHPDRRRRHVMTILAALPEDERNQLIRELPMYEQDELWEIERQSGTYILGHRNGLEQGLEQGQRIALAELILALLAERGVAVDDASEARIRGEALPALQRWARRVGEVGSVSELLASPLQ